MKKVTIITLVLTFVYLVLSTARAMAFSPADFPSCSNPQGAVIANYDSGIHGIVGDNSEHTGSDKVYEVDSNNNVQCFCPSAGEDGMQTNWFKATSLTDEQIKTYEHDGWIFIPTGKAWGLSDDPYLAKNQSYACAGSGDSNGSSESSSDSGSNDTSQGITTGVVEAASSVLGLANLASTGNTITLLSLALTSLVAFLLSFFLRRFK